MQRTLLLHWQTGTTTVLSKRHIFRGCSSLTWNSQADNSASVYNSTLINGKGRYPGGPASDLAVVNVKQGTRSVLHLHLE